MGDVVVGGYGLGECPWAVADADLAAPVVLHERLDALGEQVQAEVSPGCR